jgi:hypothetical protein
MHYLRAKDGSNIYIYMYLRRLYVYDSYFYIYFFLIIQQDIKNLYLFNYLKDLKRSVIKNKIIKK